MSTVTYTHYVVEAYCEKGIDCGAGWAECLGASFPTREQADAYAKVEQIGGYRTRIVVRRCEVEE